MTRATLIATLVTLGVVCSLCGCSVSSKQTVMETALDDHDRRQEMFEATLRVLDENPKYVDEFFALAQKHPDTLDRFLANAAKGLAEDRLARMNAKHLVQHPASLRQVMITTLDAASDKPDALRAIAESIAARPQVSSMAIAGRPETVKISFKALLAEIMKRPDSRRALLEALHENRDALAELLVSNPETAKSLMGSVVRAGGKKLTE